MARQKRSSPKLEKAVRRAAAISSIDPNLNLGNGLSLADFLNLIETVRAKENAYNSALSQVDKLYSELLETERKLADMTEHMLLGVAARYGKSSVEYAMAGGVPKNKRRKGMRGESSTDSSQSASFVTSVESNGSKNGNQNGNKASVTS